MPLNATCPNCGKSYQAPDSMAGKSVRCKACSTVFRIEAPMDEPAPGDLDFDALERSFAGEAIDSVTGKPVVDSKGKVSIPRSANTPDIGIAGETGSGVRSNFRYRFPMAKQIDQFLPWVLMLVSLGLLLMWCMNNEEPDKLPEKPTTGVALARFFMLFATYLVFVFPAAHLSMHKASRKLRFAMPRAAAWRTFTGFMPLMLLAAGLYILSGGGAVPLIFGTILGLIVSICAVAILYRLFPNELPVVSTYTGVGTSLAVAFAVAAIFAINLVALSIANLSKKPPESLVSPVALGLRWQEAPPKPIVASRTAPPAETPTTPSPATQESTPGVVPMPTVAIPRDTPGALMVKKVERPPVIPAFEVILTPPVESSSIAVVRDDSGGVIECFNTTSWLRTNTGKGFERSQGGIAPNTLGDVAMRIVHVPNYRLEAIRLGTARIPEPIIFSNDELRTLLGFVNERIVLVLHHDGAKLSLERYDVARTVQTGTTVPFGRDDAETLDVGDVRSSVRMTPDGRFILLAGRTGGDGNPGRLALYPTGDVARAEASRDLPLSSRFVFQPIGLAVDNNGKVAMLLDTANEAYFTVWQMRDDVVDGVTVIAPRRPVIDRKLGVISELRPAAWEGWYYDALVWLNEHTLLLYGTYIVDADTGTIIGNTGLTDVAGQVRVGENVVALVQRRPNQFRELLQVTFDPAAINAARKR